MAFIKERGPYQFQVRSKVQGKQIVHGTYDTRAAADKVKADLNEKLEHGFQISARRGLIALRDVMKDYEAAQRMKGTDPEDPIFWRIGCYRRDDSQYKWLADLHLARISVKTMEVFLLQRADVDEVTASTQNRDLSFLSAIFNYGRREYECTDWVNPISLAIRPKSDDARDRVMTKAERPIVEAALRASGSTYLYTAYLIALSTGMRRGEIAAATWADIDESHPDAIVLHIPKANTKTKKARGVPVSDELWAHLEILDKTTETIVGATSIAIGQAWHKAMIAAGVDDLRFHDLRHTALTQMSSTGNLDAIDLSKISGHATLKMLDRYVNPTAQELARKLKGNHRARGAA